MRVRQRSSGVGALVASFAAGYIAGLFPSADLAAKAAGMEGEVRQSGSRNPGATNAAKVLGRTWGAAVLVADITKGAAGARIGGALGGPNGAASGGIGAVVGHCFPIGRRGGKGVASRYGALAVVAPEVGLVDLAVAAVVAKTTRKADFAMTLATAVSACAGVVLLGRRARERRVSGLALTAMSGVAVLIRFFQERAREDRGQAPTGARPLQSVTS